jgi:hypothetical protein
MFAKPETLKFQLNFGGTPEGKKNSLNLAVSQKVPFDVIASVAKQSHLR